MTIYIDIAMSIIEEVSWMSKSGYSDRKLLEYIDKNYDEIECKLNGEVYKEPKKRYHNFCIKCKLTLFSMGGGHYGPPTVFP